LFLFSRRVRDGGQQEEEDGDDAALADDAVEIRAYSICLFEEKQICGVYGFQSGTERTYMAGI
jgi:hypothetical protein